MMGEHAFIIALESLWAIWKIALNDQNHFTLTNSNEQLHAQKHQKLSGILILNAVLKKKIL